MHLSSGRRTSEEIPYSQNLFCRQAWLPSDKPSPVAPYINRTFDPFGVSLVRSLACAYNRVTVVWLFLTLNTPLTAPLVLTPLTHHHKLVNVPVLDFKTCRESTRRNIRCQAPAATPPRTRRPDNPQRDHLHRGRKQQFSQNYETSDKRLTRSSYIAKRKEVTGQVYHFLKQYTFELHKKEFGSSVYLTGEAKDKVLENLGTYFVELKGDPNKFNPLLQSVREAHSREVDFRNKAFKIFKRELLFKQLALDEYAKNLEQDVANETKKTEKEVKHF
ncbi:hypothetical protein DAPPUDRAFT_103709 [Daphnia pulex]|uniref:Uncharacterized protein n=1 Tax=Daphnia pulex TaxID=6669 RepID=E9GJY0_DAPPU|nr:hypothetical protein DAPPUDRAFT_103709 [Daphnia pulex]|eukprot:EFX80244.1 hypothetical protein DAPPUDRAFT_103709 [Daphnia pulex]